MKSIEISILKERLLSLENFDLSLEQFNYIQTRNEGWTFHEIYKSIIKGIKDKRIRVKHKNGRQVNYFKLILGQYQPHEVKARVKTKKRYTEWVRTVYGGMTQ